LYNWLQFIIEHILLIYNRLTKDRLYLTEIFPIFQYLALGLQNSINKLMLSKKWSAE